jgi:hypothetical protein
MSDINILSDPFSIAIIYLLAGSPGLIVGAMMGSLAWRAHRIFGAAIGAVVGFGLGLGLVWIYIVN